MKKEDLLKLKYKILKELGYNNCEYIKHRIIFDDKKEKEDYSFICFYNDNLLKNINDGSKRDFIEIREEAKQKNNSSYLKIENEDDYVKLMTNSSLIIDNKKYFTNNNIRMAVIVEQDSKGRVQNDLYSKLIKLSKKNKKLEKYLYSKEGFFSEARLNLNIRDSFDYDEYSTKIILKENLNHNIGKVDSILDILIEIDKNKERFYNTISVVEVFIDFLKLIVKKDKVEKATNEVSKIITYMCNRDYALYDSFYRLSKFMNDEEVLKNDFFLDIYKEKFDMSNKSGLMFIESESNLKKTIKISKIIEEFKFINDFLFMNKIKDALNRVIVNSKIINNSKVSSIDEDLSISFQVNENINGLEDKLDNYLSDFIIELIKEDLSQKNELNKYYNFDHLILKDLAEEKISNDIIIKKRRKL